MHGPSIKGIAASVFLVALLLVVLIQIFGRTPLFTGPAWTEEAARWLWVWMAFIGIAAVEEKDAQIRMGFLADMFGRGGQLALFTLIDVVYAGIAAHLGWIGYETVQRTWNNTGVTLPTGDALLYASGAAAFALVLHRTVRRIAARIRTGPQDPGPQDPGPEVAP